MRNLPKFIDLVFCLIVFPIMVLIFPMERWFHSFTWYVITVIVWLYSLYFINRKLTVPLLFSDRRKRALGIIMLMLSFIITFLISRVVLYTPKPDIHDAGITRIFPSVLQYRQATWALFMIVESFSFAIGLLIQTNLQRTRRMVVEAERDKAQLELYKSQIKPHFMFNTLNSLYGLFLTQDKKALKSLEKYISMIRYVHYSSGKEFVPLREEIDYINQYVALQSLRLNEMTNIRLNIDVDNEEVEIHPMMLITFIENCFKHGVSSSEKSDIEISLSDQAGTLTMITCNRAFKKTSSGTQSGIDNCRKRLGLLYPGRHRLEIVDDGKNFKVKLIINLEQC